MKVLLATICITTLVWAEPPPSNSYLPPSPAGRSGAGGYPSGPHGSNQGFGGPQVVAARNFDTGHDHHHASAAGANGFASGGHKAAGRFGGLSEHGHKHGAGAGAGGTGGGARAGYDQNAAPFARNGDDIDREPASYKFGYMVNDYQEGTDFGHHEARQDERAEGEYHVVLPDGRKQTVSYEADERGFKPQVSYEDTEAVGRSNGGYDDNANNLHGNHGNGFNHGGHGNGRSGSGGY